MCMHACMCVGECGWVDGVCVCEGVGVCVHAYVLCGGGVCVC